MPDPDKKSRLWQIDPTTFSPLRKSGFLERRLSPILRSTGKSLLFGLVFIYPFLLVTSGLLLGGIAFWSLLGGSFAIIGAVITKFGYARNFVNWDLSLRKFGALVLAFLAALGFYQGLFHFNLWIIPMFAAVLVAGFAYYFYRSRV